ncbi:Thioredoxin domain-containing protein 5 [Perkinsus olseni]|uniref:Thioredoxin domain-containing protein 5 n=1 Tax=Perkinsus olseni TaxID=32597 RepID=A0A7J6P8M6_PEROL|nr:Thioredoxin domain-containing protein 5 [Perkinsus olseni]
MGGWSSVPSPGVVYGGENRRPSGEVSKARGEKVQLACCGVAKRICQLIVETRTMGLDNHSSFFDYDEIIQPAGSASPDRWGTEESHQDPHQSLPVQIFLFLHDIVSSLGLLPDGIRLTVRSWKSILLGSLVLACKMWDDLPVRNHAFADVLPVEFTPKVVCRCEMAVATKLCFRLWVSEEEYQLNDRLVLAPARIFCMAPPGLAFFLLLRLATSAVDTKDNVVEITSVNFDYLLREVDDPRPFLIFLHSPTCPHCQALKPIWEDVCSVAEEGQRFRVGTLDCVAQSHLCERLGETKVPSVYVFFDDGRKMLKYTGEKDGEEMTEFADAVEVPTHGPAKRSFSVRAVAKAVAAEIVTVMRFSPAGCCALMLVGFLMGILFDAFVIRVILDEENSEDAEEHDAPQGAAKAGGMEGSSSEPKKTR